MAATTGRLEISAYQSTWPARFQEIAGSLRRLLGDDAIRIDHIGSTSVPGLAAKDVIDIQVTVAALAVTDPWPDELLPGLLRRPVSRDHVPAASSTEAADWDKRYWATPLRLHVHVRQHGRPNQRYALLFRDYLRHDRVASGSYESLKRALAATVGDDWDAYYAVKDPACDLIIAAAEQWAGRVDWSPAPSDA